MHKRNKVLKHFLTLALPIGTKVNLKNGDNTIVVKKPKIYFNTVCLTVRHNKEIKVLSLEEFNLDEYLNYWFNDEQTTNKEDQSKAKINPKNYLAVYARQTEIGRAVNQANTRFQSRHNQNKPNPIAQRIYDAIEQQRKETDQ